MEIFIYKNGAWSEIFGENGIGSIKNRRFNFPRGRTGVGSKCRSLPPETGYFHISTTVNSQVLIYIAE